MSDVYLIKSVLGMNLKADIRDMDGNLISTGFKTGALPKEYRPLTPRLLDKNFFTHFNEDLLNKIREFRRIND
jgi:hypothetical protein